LDTVNTVNAVKEINELVTLSDVLEWGAHTFEQSNLCYGHGTDNPWDEAVYIAFSVLQIDFDADETILEKTLTPSEREKILALFQQRVDQRIPAAYLCHCAYFAGYQFYVDERVMIPRSPIAELIETSYAPWVNPKNVRRILDLCTGSGCIAVASALTMPDVLVDAVDLSQDALEVARKNVNHYELSDRVALIQSDLFSKIGDKQYDLIVSNPPYVPQASIASLPREYTYEPGLAFEAKIDSMVLPTVPVAPTTATLYACFFM